MAVLFEFAYSRARWAAEVLLYLITSAAYVFTLSGFGAALVTTFTLSSTNTELWFSLAPGVSTSLSVAAGTLGVRNWLGTKKRDRAADLILLSCGWASILCCVLVLVFEPMTPQHHALSSVHLTTFASWVTPMALGVGLLGFVVTTLMAARAALHGDARAWEMAASGALCGPLNLALALRELFETEIALAYWLCSAVLFVVGMMILLRTAWRRGRAHVHVARLLDERSGRDPITRLPMGAAMVKAMDSVFGASLRLKHRPVLVVVRVFNADEIVKDCGENGLNQVLLATLARIRKVTAPADLIGRYYGACFVVQISSKVSSQYLRGFGLRLAASTRRPVVPRLPPSGFEDDEPIETDVGVGICWCDELDDLTVALHEAELAAEAARGMRSRAAVKLRPDEEPLAVEKALGQAQLRPGFMDSATNKLRSVPGRLFSSSATSQAITKAVRKVVRKSAIGVARPLRGTKMRSRNAKRGLGRDRAGEPTRAW